MIYLDHHSASRPCAPALDRMAPYLREQWGASFAPHRFGQQLLADCAPAYETIYEAFRASRKETFVFTSSGAEAVAQVLWSVFLEVARKEGKSHFIASGLEDAPTMQNLKRLEELGCYVKIAPVNAQGQIDVEELSKLISPRTALISVTLAQGLTGVVQPIDEISKLAREKGVLLHADATYAVGKMDLSFSDLGIDYLTFSGDRIHSVKSSGGLFAKEGRPLVPLILGGTEQAGLKGGALDVPSLMALAAALQQASLSLDTMGLEGVRLRDLLESEILRRFPDAKIWFSESLRLPNVSSLCFPGVHQEALLYYLSRKGIYASMGGSYCQHLSRLLIASKIPEKEALSSLSFSLSRMTTEEEVLQAAKGICDAALRLRALSGVFWGISGVFHES